MMRKINFILIVFLFLPFVIADSYQFQSYYSGNYEIISTNSYSIENSPYSSPIKHKNGIPITSEAVKEQGKGSFLVLIIFIMGLIGLTIWKRKFLKTLIIYKLKKKNGKKK